MGDDSELRSALEAIVMVAEEPADPRLLAQLLEVGPDVVEATCESLAAEYSDAGRGFELVKVAGGWRFQSRSDLSPYVERFVLSGQTARLSAAALETLAIAVATPRDMLNTNQTPAADCGGGAMKSKNVASRRTRTSSLALNLPDVGPSPVPSRSSPPPLAAIVDVRTSGVTGLSALRHWCDLARHEGADVRGVEARRRACRSTFGGMRGSGTHPSAPRAHLA